MPAETERDRNGVEGGRENGREGAGRGWPGVWLQNPRLIWGSGMLPHLYMFRRARNLHLAPLKLHRTVQIDC